MDESTILLDWNILWEVVKGIITEVGNVELVLRLSSITVKVVVIWEVVDTVITLLVKITPVMVEVVNMLLGGYVMMAVPMYE